MTMQETAQDPASLQRLNDIVVPDATAWWPPAPGWYVLGILLLLAGLILAVSAIRHWWKNRYRTAALRELNVLREAFGTPTPAEPRRVVAGINRILKRTALVGWPRDEVATLAGDSWIEFLNRTGHQRLFSADQANAMVNIAWSSAISQQMSPSQVNSLFDSAAVWIRQHKTNEHGSESGPGKADGS